MCSVRTFTDRHDAIALPRARMTTRAAKHATRRAGPGSGDHRYRSRAGCGWHTAMAAVHRWGRALLDADRGRLDAVMMRIVDLLTSIPLVIYVILIMVLVGNRGLWTMTIALGSVYWVVMARLVRGQVLALKEQEFVLAARALGVKRTQIILRHLIPNAIGPIIVTMTMMIPQAVFTEAFIGFIGLGVSAPKASWGTLANDALSGLLSYPYQLFFPALAIAFTMLSFNFLGDGLRDALDPRLRKG